MKMLKLINIIQDFYDAQYLRIKDKIILFYVLTNSKNLINKLPLLNPIECLIKLKRVI